MEWYKKVKKTPNMTKLATTSMPLERGRKGSVSPPKKRKKVEVTTRIRFSEVHPPNDDSSESESEL